MEMILTPDTARAARQKINLSQGKVAADLGINRAYLSLFESGKYLFDESLLSSLRHYYEEHGHAFNDVADAADDETKTELPFLNACLSKNDFRISSRVDETEAKTLLAAYTDNRNKIISLCQKAPKEVLFWIDEEDLEDRKKEVLMLMARNYVLTEQLRGHQAIPPSSETTKNNKKRTIGEYVSELLT